MVNLIGAFKNIIRCDVIHKAAISAVDKEQISIPAPIDIYHKFRLNFNALDGVIFPRIAGH